MPQPGTTVLPRIERRLAAILAADVARYSQLMGVDEVGTLAALKSHRNERIDPVIARHHGRIVKTTGDGLLVEFASVVDAVACAVAIQRGMLAFNEGVHVDRQIVLRIGINVGDIIIDGNDIFGDGVNVAARLEALCEPGGICISRSANEQVRDKLSLTFADLGERTVKNIARAIGVFGLAPSDIAALPDDAMPQPFVASEKLPATRRYRGKILAAVVVTLSAVVAAGGGWLLHEKGDTTVAAVAPATVRPVADSPQDRRFSVIVMPFANSSTDLGQDGFATGLTRDVTERIAADTGAPTIPAITAAAYHGKPVDLRMVAREHDVHFILTGNATRRDGHLIVSASLYETESGRTIWSQQYDRADQPGAADSIVQSITTWVEQSSMDAEAARATREHPDNLDKRDLMIASYATPLQQITRENYAARLALIQRALVLDPNYMWALRADGRVRADRVFYGFSPDTTADLAQALRSVDRALLLAPNDYNTLREKSRVLRAQGDLDGAAAVIRRLIELKPAVSYRYNDLGWILMAQGHPKEALDNFMTAKRLATDTEIIQQPLGGNLAVALVANDRFAEAIPQARLAIARFTSENGRDAEVPWLALIASESLSGQDAQARADLDRFLGTPRTWHSLAQIRTFPFLAANTQLLEGLRRAGMPAE
jgi:class 3 adenylate cyclase/TolB-like protein